MSFLSSELTFWFKFQVKTQSQDAVLFYNTGPSSNKDFVALEISKGKPRLLVDQVSPPDVLCGTTLELSDPSTNNQSFKLLNFYQSIF